MISRGGADITGVTLRASWFYTRAADSIRMDLLEQPAAFVLIVHGPDPYGHLLICGDYLEAMRAQFVYEEQCLAGGYRLAGFADPRTQPPAGAASSAAELHIRWRPTDAVATAITVH